MNITIIKLVSLAILSQSPYFTGNQLSIAYSNFKKFSSTIFYNQQKLYLKSLTFSYGLNSIVHNSIIDSDNSHYILVENKEFNTTYDEYGDFFPGEHYYSISIINCIFNSIDTTFKSANRSAIYIKSFSLTVYITNCLFDSCTNYDGTIYLESRSCETTHCCFSDCIGSYDKSILSCTLTNTGDFIIFLYNTISNAKLGNSEGRILQCQNGDQYFRCNNITNCDGIGFYMNDLRYLSFFMNTANDIKNCCLFFLGNNDNKYLIYEKKIDHVNFCTLNKYISSEDYKKDVLIYVETPKPFNVTIVDSVLLSNVSSMVRIKGSSENFHFNVANCIINEKFNDDDVVNFINCTRVKYDTNYIQILPHFTYDDYCIGPDLDDKISAYGCNIGKCMDEDCEFTFSFSANLLPFKTVHYLEIQTATFSPSEFFSNSDSFTKSMAFSNSKEFSFSNHFTFSDHFSPSGILTKTVVPSSLSLLPIPTQIEKNNLKTYSQSMSEIIVTVKTVSFFLSNHLTISFYDCTNENGLSSICYIETISNYYLPYIITVFSKSLIPTFFEQEINLKKQLSSEVIIGISCGSVSAFFAIVGIIILVKNRQNLVEFSDIYDDSSDLDAQKASQTDVQINENAIENVDLNDKWL